jgi:hypothetical protein
MPEATYPYFAEDTLTNWHNKAAQREKTKAAQREKTKAR